MDKQRIPEFLIEMSKQINEQDNRMTADPLFEVRYKDYVVTAEGYNEHHWEIIDEDGCALYHSEKSENLDLLAEYLFENHDDYWTSFIIDKDSDLDPTTCTESEFVELLNDDFDSEWDCDDLPDELSKVHLQEIERTVNSHFTEKDAQAFIDRKQHDYPKLYVYAISLCFCENMAKLRNWIKELNK